MVRFGTPLGPVSLPTPVEENGRHPADALTAAISKLLDSSSCYVAFSGGCDSSLVLCAATTACRAVGHNDPIPVTYRYSAPETDESGYQEAVVRHLGLNDWIKLDLGIDADLLSPSTCDELLTGGAMWPPAPLTRAKALRGLGGGLWLSGEGGDAVFGPRRVSYAERAVHTWLRRPHRPPWGLLRRGLGELAPRRLRIRSAEADYTRNYGAEWLDADLRQRYFRDAAVLVASEPLLPSRWYGHYLSLPSVRIGHESLRAFKSGLGLRWQAPLVDREFLGALSGALSWHEYRGRRHLLRALFSELLPAQIIDRRTKVAFNTALFGPYTRKFAAEWSGEGTPAGVDSEWLKLHWQSSQVFAGTAPLLHHVWLARQRAQSTHPGSRCG